MKSVKFIFPASLFALCALLVAGCATPQGDTASEKRASVQEMTQNTLAEAYRLNPGLQTKVKRAAGYGVFSNRGTKFLVVSSGSGYGLVRDNRTGRDTYMRMAEVGGGLGFGVKEFRAVFGNDARPGDGRPCAGGYRLCLWFGQRRQATRSTGV